MPTLGRPHVVILIDHANVPWERINPRTLVEGCTEALGAHLPEELPIRIHLRAYGGWYADDVTTPTRYNAADFYQEHCPVLIRVSRGLLRLSFEFADTLLRRPRGLAEPVRISHTVVRRSAAPRCSRVPDAPSCDEPECNLRATRRWIRGKAACHKPACPTPFSAQFERFEQKQVDVHLVLDLLALLGDNQPPALVTLVSDDADFLPALFVAAEIAMDRCTPSLLRFHGSSRYLDAQLLASGVKIVTL
jgi:hypothetical protein